MTEPRPEPEATDQAAVTDQALGPDTSREDGVTPAPDGSREDGVNPPAGSDGGEGPVPSGAEGVITEPPAQPVWSPPGYPQPGYSPPGYQQPGDAPPGYPPPGYAPQGYPQPGYSPPGYPQPGDTAPGYPPPGYAPQGYQQPGYPQQFSPPPVKQPATPVVVWASFACWVFAVALAIIALVAQYTYSSALATGTRADIARLGLGTSLAADAIFPLVPLAFAIVMRAGYNWARITVTVLGGFRVLASLAVPLTLAGGGAAPEYAHVAWLEIGSGLLVAAAIVLMWLPTANRYFALSAAARRSPAV